jgi:hypothetical protein
MAVPPSCGALTPDNEDFRREVMIASQLWLIRSVTVR